LEPRARILDSLFTPDAQQHQHSDQSCNIDVSNLSSEFPLAASHGTSDARWTDKQIAAITSYVADGGVLLIDACGGSPPSLKTCAPISCRALFHMSRRKHSPWIIRSLGLART